MTPTSFKTSITQYMPDTGTILTTESTTESIGLLNGKKAENLTAVIQRHQSTTRAFCYAIIPTAIIGIALLIAAIIVWAKYGYEKLGTNMALFIPSMACFFISASLSGAYCSHRKRPVVLDTEATPV